jgi:xylulokinase
VKSILMGIDVGTTGLKIGCYSIGGQLVDRAYREYSLSFLRPGWVEMDPETWWDACCEALHEIFSRGRVHPLDVAGIGITCTNSLVLMDNDKRVVRPAIMQLDQRAAATAEKLKQELGEESVFQRTGNRISSGAFWGPALGWLKEHEPQVLKQSRYYLVPTSFLVLKLADVYCIDHSRATSTMLYDIHRKTWDRELCHAFSIPLDDLPPIFRSSDPVGSVSSKGALATGLMEGTPIIAGAMDTIGALVGLGSGSTSGALIMGTVGRICIETDHLDDRFMNTVNADATRKICMTPINSAGVSYKWLKNLIFEAEIQGKNLYEFMDQIAEGVKPGAEGVLFLPYLSGERSPIWDPHACGSFLGLKLHHTKAHLIRAVLEGVGFALAHNYEILNRDCGIDLQILCAGGGGAASCLWMQIVSDILGKPMCIPEELEAETKGAAFLVGLGNGLIRPDDATVIQEWAKFARRIQPDPQTHAFYQQILPIYKEFYDQNKSLFSRLQQVQNQVPWGGK